MVAQWRKMAQAAGLMLAVGADMRIDDAARIITGVPGGAIEQQNYAPSTITSVRSFRPACAKEQRRLAQKLMSDHVSVLGKCPSRNDTVPSCATAPPSS
jgi:hypothetical protein